jgi:FkbM family methyltransferase
MLAFRIFSYLDNSGNADFDTNGERKFVENLFQRIARTDRGRYVFFDVGANVGEYTQMLLDKIASLHIASEVHVFEPTQSCFEVLTTKFGCMDYVILNRKAVSNSASAVEIYYDTEKSALASLYKRNLDAYSVEMNRSEIVETIRLDMYIETMGVRHIHLLKIDIEGHEFAAFEGLGAYLNGDFIDFVQFEYGGANLDSHTSLMDLYSVFNKAGFVMTKVMRNGLEVRQYYPWMDNFQYANFVAVSRRIMTELQ